jgi:hypothetical protein
MVSKLFCYLSCYTANQSPVLVGMLLHRHQNWKKLLSSYGDMKGEDSVRTARKYWNSTLTAIGGSVLFVTRIKKFSFINLKMMQYITLNLKSLIWKSNITVKHRYIFSYIHRR